MTNTFLHSAASSVQSIINNQDKYVFDATVAVAGGGLADLTTTGPGIPILATLLAPIIKELVLLGVAAIRRKRKKIDPTVENDVQDTTQDK